MPLPALLTRLRTGAALPVRILWATGFGAVLPPTGLALIVVLLVPDEAITEVGPVSVQPPVSVVLLVALLLSVGCAVAHATWASPVLRRGPRIHLARAGSYLASLTLACGVVALAGRLGTTDLSAGMLRNLLWLSGAGLAVTALSGITYAWLPAVLAAGSVLLTAPTDDPWTLYGLLFHPQATPGQLRFAGAVYAVGFVLAVVDPMSRGYLRSPRRSYWRVSAVEGCLRAGNCGGGRRGGGLRGGG